MRRISKHSQTQPFTTIPQPARETTAHSTTSRKARKNGRRHRSRGGQKTRAKPPCRLTTFPPAPVPIGRATARLQRLAFSGFILFLSRLRRRRPTREPSNSNKTADLHVSSNIPHFISLCTFCLLLFLFYFHLTRALREKAHLSAASRFRKMWFSIIILLFPRYLCHFPHLGNCIIMRAASSIKHSLVTFVCSTHSFEQTPVAIICGLFYSSSFANNWPSFPGQQRYTTVRAGLPSPLFWGSIRTRRSTAG